MLDGLRLLLAYYKHFEFIWKRQRYPISRLFITVLVCKVFRPIQNHNDLRIFIHIFFVLFVRDFQPFSKLGSQLVVKNLNSLVDFVYLTDFGHHIIDERLIFILIVRNFFLLLVWRFVDFGFCSSLRVFVISARMLNQWLERC